MGKRGGNMMMRGENRLVTRENMGERGPHVSLGSKDGFALNQ